MKYKAKYSIGEVSRICNISKKALRYYDDIGLITTQRKDYNNYRYYTFESLQSVPVIKYYKQMGFTLDEMRHLVESNRPNISTFIQKSFLAKIAQLEKDRESIHRQYLSVKDWYELVLEADQVLENNIQEVSVKYVEASELLFLEQEYDGNLMASIINIDFTNYLGEQGNEIAGPVIINFSSVQDRLQNTAQKMRIMQKPLLPASQDKLTQFGGYTMITCYHIGSHDTLHKTYVKIQQWAQKYGYTLANDSYERYVVDYWTTKNHDQFVTEIMVKAWKPRLQP